MERKSYPSDLNDAEWQIIEPLIPPAKTGGRPREQDMCEIVNAMFYLLRAGCSWRMLPHDFPPWQTVYYYFAQWRDGEIFRQMNDMLRARLRVAAGREEQPSAAILDSQSVKTTETKGERGYDAGKKVNGRKRHILVDTMGLLLMVVVHIASVQDRDGAMIVLQKAKQSFWRLQLIWADGGYAGKLVDWAKESCQWILEIVKRNGEVKGFHVLPRRWVVERTLAWIGRYRRLSKDYESLTQTSETMIYAAMVNILIRRLARNNQALRS
ncbi:MAG: IS5 family transposase [Methanosarcinales archaeon]|nr:IS5 family transposase [Methanosarcinales archaeon]